MGASNPRFQVSYTNGEEQDVYIDDSLVDSVGGIVVHASELSESDDIGSRTRKKIVRLDNPPKRQSAMPGPCEREELPADE